MKLEGLKRAPFNLDDAGLSWVEASFASLSPDQKLGQIMLPLTGDLSTQSPFQILPKRKYNDQRQGAQ